jgi:hypothetical protein
MSYDTELDKSGLIPTHIMQDAGLSSHSVCYDRDSSADWIDDIRAKFFAALDDGRPEWAAALVYDALMFAHDAKTESDMLYLQGVALTKMIEAGGPPDLHDFRVCAFQYALDSLLEDRGWSHQEILCRIQLAMAWHAAGEAKGDADRLDAASAEYSVLIPALRDGRLGNLQHAKAAELSVLRAQAYDKLTALGSDDDTLPSWLYALKLALDPKLRSEDTLGYWDAAMEPLEKWLDELRYKLEAKEAGSAVRDALQALDIPPDNPDHGWVQYYIGVFAMAAGLQTEGLRSEAKDADDEDELVSAVTGYRHALSAIEQGDSGNWPGTAFQLAYALHSLGEARADVAVLDEAISLYEKVVARLADADDQEDCLLVAQTQTNLSEAMAQKAEIKGDAALARQALGIAAEAEMGFTLWAHDEGIEVAQANCARISGIIDEIESR